MFTGIIQAVGRVKDLKPKGNDRQLRVDLGQLDIKDVASGR